jgi:agmatine deiminase
MAERRFPAEWERQQGVLLCFPHNGNDWPGKFGAIQWAFVEFIKKVTAHEQVFLVVDSPEHQQRVAAMLTQGEVPLTKVTFIPQRTNRSWMRDSGPIIVHNGKKREAINFHFNGWAKYANHQLDRHVPQAVADVLGVPLVPAIHKGKKVVLEGGALEVNGKGTLITTDECLLHPNIQVRNAGFTREDYEAVFREYLGITNTIWLADGIMGDDTHGHIDDLCRFVNPTTVVTVVESDPKDDNYKHLQRNLQLLKAAKLEDGSSLRVVELPMPRPVVFDGLRIPASYANFLIINGCVLVPTFNDPADRHALNILADCFPDRAIIGISAIDLIWGFGTLHCLSQQIPVV